jgi:hypothetical protein
MSNVTTTVRPSFSTSSVQTIYHVTATLANTEYSQPLNNATKAIMIKVLDGKANLRFTLTAGGTSTVWVPIPKGAVYYKDNLDLSNTTVYVQSDTSGKIIVIEEWT